MTFTIKIKNYNFGRNKIFIFFYAPSSVGDKEVGHTSDQNEELNFLFQICILEMGFLLRLDKFWGET